MKLTMIGLPLLAVGLMATSALAQTGTMQPIPNPPEKPMAMKHHKMKHHMHHHVAKKDDDAAKDKAEASATPMKK